MKTKLLLISLIGALLASCNESTTPVVPPEYDDTSYILNTQGLPTPKLPADNALTVQKVKLGRMLFFEKMLSINGTQSCASCHVQKDGLSDIRQFSLGAEGLAGKRQAMAITNLAWHNNGFFWDGRARLLRDQSLMPIQDPLEMNETLPNVVAKLAASSTYRDQFVRAFGSDTITSEKMSLAMEQFMFTIVSGNSKFDKLGKGLETLTDSEDRGRKLFFTEFDPMGAEQGAECFHCHGGPNFSNNMYMNNGLDAEKDFTDLGRYEVTNNPQDRAKFKVTSLRNIAITPPYMHDGRFNTLEQVVEHYAVGVKQSSTVDFLMQYNLQPGGLKLTDQDKADLVAFLKTLTDVDLVSNPGYGPIN